MVVTVTGDFVVSTMFTRLYILRMSTKTFPSMFMVFVGKVGHKCTSNLWLLLQIL